MDLQRKYSSSPKENDSPVIGSSTRYPDSPSGPLPAVTFRSGRNCTIGRSGAGPLIAEKALRRTGVQPMRPGIRVRALPVGVSTAVNKRIALTGYFAFMSLPIHTTKEARISFRIEHPILTSLCAFESLREIIQSSHMPLSLS
jgi:hypothetical protein